MPDMLPKYSLQPGQYGQDLVLNGPWSDALIPLFKGDVTGLWVNYARGFVGENVEFLRLLPQLKSLSIAIFQFSDISPVNSLHELLDLHIGHGKYSGVDFSNFPKLERCGSDYWLSGFHSIFNCDTLKKLYLSHYPKPDLTPFAQLKRIERLIIANSPLKSLHGLNELPELRKLGLYNLRTLTDISALHERPELIALDIQGCRKLTNIDDVAVLKHLRRLGLSSCGDIDSIKPILELKELVDFLFDGTNIVDGDLTPLVKLPKLEVVGFTNHKHYTHKSGDFPHTGYVRTSMD